MNPAIIANTQNTAINIYNVFGVFIIASFPTKLSFFDIPIVSFDANFVNEKILHYKIFFYILYVRFLIL